MKKSIDDLSDKIDRLSAMLEQRHMRGASDVAHVDSVPQREHTAKAASASDNQGYGDNRFYRGYVGDERPMSLSPAPIPFTSALCQQLHFSLDQYRFWTRAIKEPPRYHRKQWEFVYVSQALFERGMLAPGKTGLGFGVGLEPLPSLFASFGAKVVASDQSLEGAVRAGWASTNQHSTDLSVLNNRGICTDRMFTELVSFAEVDMNAIDQKFDGQFDFCWSACSLEHLGSLDHGIQFIKNSMRVLKPGGVAVHTTEFNLSSNDATIEHPDLSVYRRRDIDRVVAELIADGHAPTPVDYHLGEGFADIVIDLPPYVISEPHIRLRIADFDCTSIGLIIQRAA